MLSGELLKKAQRFLPANISKYIKNHQVFPNWLSEGKQFWYETQNEDGQCFYLVDISKGTKTLIEDPREKEKRTEPVPPSRCFTAMQAWGMQPAIPADRLRSPDGQWDLTTQNFNVFLTNNKSGAIRQLTCDGEKFYDWASSPDCNLAKITNARLGTIAPPIAIWSDDSTKILTHKVDQRQVKELHLLQNSPENGSHRPELWSIRMPFAGDKEVTKTELYVLDIVGQKTVKINTPPIQSTMIGSSIESNYAWFSKTADRVYFIREERGNKKLELCVADTETGECRTIITESSPQYVETSYLIFWLNYTRTLDETNEAVWLSERDGWMNLYLVDTEKGGIKNPIAKGNFNVRSVLYVDEKERWVYFPASGREEEIDPYLRILYRAKLDGSSIERLTPADADHTISFAPDGESFVDNYSTMDTTPATKLFSKTGKELMHLKTADFSTLYNFGWQQPETFCLKGADGKTDIYGTVYRPTDFDPKRSYGIVDDIYPGPQLVRVARSYHLDPPENMLGPWQGQAFAELGFIVVNIDGRGTPLRSREFHHYSHNNLQSGGGLEDHIAVIKQLAEKYPYMDTDRVGIIGWSQGGYAATRALLTYPDFYKVGVSFAGDHDLRTYLSFWGEKVQEVGDNKSYDAYSNPELANKLQGKLFLIHGELDDNVHPANTLQMVDALIKADKDFDMLLVPNENHGAFFTNPYVIRRMWEYLVRNLQ